MFESIEVADDLNTEVIETVVNEEEVVDTENNSEVEDSEAPLNESESLLIDPELFKNSSQPLLQILDKPAYFMSVTIDGGNQTLSISHEMLGFSAEEAKKVRSNRISNMRTDMFKSLTSGLNKIKKLRDKMYRTLGLIKLGDMYLVPEAKLEEFMQMYNELDGSTLNEVKDAISAEYHNDVNDLNNRLNDTLREINNVSDERRREIILKARNQIPELPVVLAKFKLILNGPYKIPSITELAQRDNELQAAIVAGQEIQYAAQLQVENYNRIQTSMQEIVLKSQQDLQQMIYESVRDLQQAKSKGKLRKSPTAFSEVIKKIQDLQAFVAPDGNLADILNAVQVTQETLNQKNPDVERVNSALTELLTYIQGDTAKEIAEVQLEEQQLAMSGTF